MVSLQRPPVRAAGSGPMPTARRGFMFGDVTIDRVVEMLGPVREPGALFPDWSGSAWDAELPWMAPDFVDQTSGHYISSIQSWVLRQTGGPTIIVDTCVGNGRERPHSPRYHALSSPYVADMQRLGVAAEAVDIVVLTHLHEDHVGWNTHWHDDGWKPMFPNARYLVSKLELDSFLARADHRPPIDDSTLILADSIAPLIAAGLLDTFDPPFAFAPGLTLEEAPGHTVGQCVLRLTSCGQDALFTADVLHHPIQIIQPGWSTRFCEHPEIAALTRHRILAEAADRNVLLCPGHFGQRQLARISRNEQGYRPVWIDLDKKAAGT